ncbi:hypothetical protein C8R45DRAFT_1222707 [Mycena sanguinolenta]|nr:hypothetical protein C8R45DRAFT_1222707 [Mycena sanguinolenta]
MPREWYTFHMTPAEAVADLGKPRTSMLKAAHFRGTSRASSVSGIMSSAFGVPTRQGRSVFATAGFELWMQPWKARHRTLRMSAPASSTEPVARALSHSIHRLRGVLATPPLHPHQYDAAPNDPECESEAENDPITDSIAREPTQVFDEDEVRSVAHEGVARGEARWFRGALLLVRVREPEGEREERAGGCMASAGHGRRPRAMPRAAYQKWDNPVVKTAENTGGAAVPAIVRVWAATVPALVLAAAAKGALPHSTTSRDAQRRKLPQPCLQPIPLLPPRANKAIRRAPVPFLPCSSWSHSETNPSVDRIASNGVRWAYYYRHAGECEGEGGNGRSEEVPASLPVVMAVMLVYPASPRRSSPRPRTSYELRKDQSRSDSDSVS